MKNKIGNNKHCEGLLFCLSSNDIPRKEVCLSHKDHQDLLPFMDSCPGIHGMKQNITMESNDLFRVPRGFYAKYHEYI